MNEKINKLTSIEFEERFINILEMQEIGVVRNAGKLFKENDLEDCLENLEELKGKLTGSYFKGLVQRAIEIVNRIEEARSK